MAGLVLIVVTSSAWAGARPDVTLVPQMGGSGTPVVFSPDDSLIAVTGHSGVVVIWDAETGQQLWEFDAASGYCWPPPAAQFGPDSRLMACARRGQVGLWDLRTGGKLRSFDGHVFKKRPAFGPDWRWLALEDKEGNIAIWDVASGERRHLLKAHEGEVLYLAFDRSGDNLVSAGADGRVVWWSPESGGATRTLELTGHDSEVSRVTLSGDGRRVLSFSNDPRTVVLADPETGGEIHRWGGAKPESGFPFSPSGFTAEFSPDGSKLLHTGSGAFHASASLWDAETGEQIAALRQVRTVGFASVVVYGWTTAAGAFSPDGALLASARDGGKTLIVIDANTGVELRELARHPDGVFAIGFSPDGRLLATRARDGQTTFWDTDQWQPRYTISAPKPVFSHDSRRFVASTGDGYQAVWDAERGEVVAPLMARRHWVDLVSFEPEGLVTVLSGPGAMVWDLEALRPTLRCHSTLKDGTHTVPIKIARHIDGRLTFAGLDSPWLFVWDALTGERPAEFEKCPDTPRSLAWSADGRFLAAGCGKKDVGLWDAQTGQLVRLLEGGHENRAEAVSFSPDSTVLASLCIGDVLCLWDVASGEQLARVERPGMVDRQRALPFTPDGTAVAVGTADGGILLFESPSGRLLREFEPHATFPEASVFSGDSKLFAAGDWDGLIAVWDVETGRLVRTLSGHRDHVTSVAFAPGDGLLASASADGTVRLWDVARWETAAILWAVGDPLWWQHIEAGQDAQSVSEYDWVVWSPEGYYDCSRDGEEFIRFRDRDHALHPAGDYREVLRRPDVLRWRVARALAGGR